MPTDEKDSGLADQSLKPTAATEWKKPLDFIVPMDREGFIVDLPSGNVVRMTRTMDMAHLLKMGKIPNPLAGIVQGMIDQRTDKFPDDMDTGAISQLLDLMNEMAVRCIIEPPFAMPDRRKPDETGEQYQDRLSQWQAPEGKVSVWDLSPEDRQYIFAISQGAAADLASFRAWQEELVASLQDGAGVPKPTKRTTRAKSKK